MLPLYQLIIWKYSAIGPSDSAGKKLRAPTSSTTNIRRNTNIPLLVDRVPAVTATFFFFAILPAMRSMVTRGKNLAPSITRPMETLRKGVLALKPAKAEPLLPPPEEDAYSTSDKPCAPALFRLSAVEGRSAAIQLPKMCTRDRRSGCPPAASACLNFRKCW